MFNHVGEVLDGARRVGLLGRILGGGVGFGDVGKDDLHIGFGSEGSRFEEWLLVVNATLIHVLT